MTAAEKEDWESVFCHMNQEGFDYCFTSYSDFTEIKDEEFHELRLGYLDAMYKLKKYVTIKSECDVE